MDKEEFHAKSELISQLVNEKDYKGALELVDSIEWKRVKDTRTLCIAGEVYAANKRYQESKEIFLMAYNRSPLRKNILYRLIEVSIKMNDMDDALNYYQQYLDVAPNDNSQYILKYKIASAQKIPLEDQIQILEEYKEREYTERWSYELAKLYHQAGQDGKCVDVCDDIVLWFSEGEYVIKSLELKRRLTELTPRQKEIYKNLLEPKIFEPSESYEISEPAETPEEEIMQADQSVEVEYESYENIEEENGNEEYEDENADAEELAPIADANGSLQEKISKGIKDIFAGIVKEWEEEDELLESYPGTPKINIADVIPPQKIEESIKEKELEAFQEEFEEEGEEELSENDPEEVIEENSEEELQTGLEEVENYLAEDLQTEQIQEAEQLDNYEELQIQLEQAETEVIEEDGIQEQPNLAQEMEDIQEESKESQESEIQSKEEKVIKFDTSRLPKLELPEFNLEEVILSAAEKQGIGVPDAENENISDSPEQTDENLPEAIEEDPKEEENPEPSVISDKVQPEGEIRPQDEVLSEEESLLQFIEEKDAREQEEQDVIIPRGETLDDVEMKLFSYFSSIPGMKEQLVEALADAQMAATDKTSRFGNIIVMGNLRTGKTKLTESLIRTICRELRMPAAKIATVEASQLNDKDIPKIVSKLAGGFLVIQKTSQLTSDSVVQLNQSMEFRTDGLTVILEDEKIGMRKFIAKYQKFAKKFTSTINIPVFTNDELVNFAKIYADEMGYVMDTMGVLALYNLIGDNQKEDEPMTIGAVKDMMDVAITKAESNHRKLQRSISKKRFDSEGKVILYEKDFK